MWSNLFLKAPWGQKLSLRNVLCCNFWCWLVRGKRKNSVKKIALLFLSLRQFRAYKRCWHTSWRKIFKPWFCLPNLVLALLFMFLFFWRVLSKYLQNNGLKKRVLEHLVRVWFSVLTPLYYQTFTLLKITLSIPIKGILLSHPFATRTFFPIFSTTIQNYRSCKIASLKQQTFNFIQISNHA